MARGKPAQVNANIAAQFHHCVPGANKKEVIAARIDRIQAFPACVRAVAFDREVLDPALKEKAQGETQCGHPRKRGLLAQSLREQATEIVDVHSHDAQPFDAHRLGLQRAEGFDPLPVRQVRHVLAAQVFDLLRVDGGRHVDQEPAAGRGSAAGPQLPRGLIAQGQHEPAHGTVRGEPGRRVEQRGLHAKPGQHIFPRPCVCCRIRRPRFRFSQHQAASAAQLGAQFFVRNAGRTLANALVTGLLVLHRRLEVLGTTHLALPLLIPSMPLRPEQHPKVAP